MTTSKASVQYNDFMGTSAADISDYSTLIDFANHHRIDTLRFVPQGISIYGSYDHFVSVALLCQDKERDNRLISIQLPDMQIADVLNQFKRFHVMLFRKYYEPVKEIEEISVENIHIKP